MSAFSWIFSSTQTRRNRCNKLEMWLFAKNSSLLSPDLTLIILHISLRNLRVLGSIGPRTSMHIGKNSIEGKAFPYFFIFSSAALAAAKPHSLLVRFTHRSARVPETVTSHAKHLPALQGISVHPSGRLPSCAEIPDGSLRTGIEALEKSRQMQLLINLLMILNDCDYCLSAQEMTIRSIKSEIWLFLAS
ncbi:hypothetical protein HELRODRAFT_176720 [Helobdella robusta]|uniref:Uncharacterized protein n=1 Tax=Helobdella robusta TaxID=6412 RepID=T1FAT9_HELRO|nr:hypothetical protein HELRODRAFT_176720 [Helobdella robusta]ESN99553.1 hypothetical protein HELRODRAFT_176720 [Helobdella robusta]